MSKDHSNFDIPWSNNLLDNVWFLLGLNMSEVPHKSLNSYEYCKFKIHRLLLEVLYTTNLQVSHYPVVRYSHDSINLVA